MSKRESDFLDHLIIERIFDAPREMVWKAWTDPTYVSRWWGPKDFTAPFCKIDFRVGGRFHYCMRSPNGEEYWNVGEYREIIFPTKIVSVMYFSDKDGNRLAPSHYGFSSDFPDEMLDVVTFEAIGIDKTRFTLQRNHSIAIAKHYGEDQGWSQSLDKLVQVLAAHGRQL